MTVEEITKIAKTAVSLGITRVKLTGGEPLMREDLPEIIQNIRAISGLRDLSLTTNGLRLGGGLAKRLYDSGLHRINISLASLNPQTYRKLTGGDLPTALSGIEAAVEAGFNPVKLNMVVLQDVNVVDVPAMIDYAAKMGVILQLIELDPINVGEDYYKTHHRGLEEQEKMLASMAESVEQRPFMHNRKIYHLKNATVEVVHPIENTDFCMHCTRMRVTSDGKLKPCLMRNDNLTDILTPLKNGATNQELQELFIQANQLREPYNKKS
jgi:cyclic pyranopterin phosphate synthase